MSTTSQLSAALAAAADEPVTEVTLDLAGVTFIDSSALRVLVLSGRSAGRRRPGPPDRAPLRAWSPASSP